MECKLHTFIKWEFTDYAISSTKLITLYIRMNNAFGYSITVLINKFIQMIIIEIKGA